MSQPRNLYETCFLPFWRKIRPVFSDTIAGLLPRFLVLIAAMVFLGASARDIFLSHDGWEYYQFAEKLAENQLTELPEGVLRHDPGLPILLAFARLLTFHAIPLIWAAVFVHIAASILLVKCFHFLLAGDSQNQTFSQKWGSLALLAGYPAIVYYGMINLTETVFTAALFGGLCMILKEKRGLGYFLIGVGILIRTTGVFMLFAVNMAALIHELKLKRRSMAAVLARLSLYNLTALLPWAIWQWFSHAQTHTTSLSVHKPVLSYPFSGFVLTPDVSTVRLIYILIAVGFITVSVIAMITLSFKSKKESFSQTVFAWFCGSFLLFHLCLKTLFYIDRDVYTLNYQDRYLIPLWLPLMIFYSRFLNRYTVLPAVLVSCGISFYWIRNFLIADGKLG